MLFLWIYDFSLKKEKKFCAREMAQWLKHLLHKGDNQSSGLQKPHESGAEETKPRISQGKLAC